MVAGLRNIGDIRRGHTGNLRPGRAGIMSREATSWLRRRRVPRSHHARSPEAPRLPATSPPRRRKSRPMQAAPAKAARTPGDEFSGAYARRANGCHNQALSFFAATARCRAQMSLTPAPWRTRFPPCPLPRHFQVMHIAPEGPWPPKKSADTSLSMAFPGLRPSESGADDTRRRLEPAWADRVRRVIMNGPLAGAGSQLALRSPPPDRCG